MASQTFESQGVRVAVEGCGHGTLHAIYAAVDQSCKARGWDSVDVLIIGGDFQAVRNAADLNAMSVPAKYREMGDFWEYYSGVRTAPYLTLFIAGNHEASSHLWELFYGGWVAPNIYYLGAANVLRLGPLRIAGMSGIWKGFDYRKPHHERLPFSYEDVKSFYHVREIDVRKLLLLRTQVDVGLSHDWPRAIEKWGDENALFRMKPDFRQESKDGTLGNRAAEYVLDRLRPVYWFSAHLHCKFTALKTYEEGGGTDDIVEAGVPQAETGHAGVGGSFAGEAKPQTNPEEIDLDLEDEEPSAPGPSQNPDPAATSVGDKGLGNPISEDLRSQLPASFMVQARKPKTIPGQPVPAGITNKQVRFLALDKCLPKRKFLQLLDISPHDSPSSDLSLSLNTAAAKEERAQPGHPGRFQLEYDPEWLAITRVFHPHLQIGKPGAPLAPDLGEEEYASLIDAEHAWVDEHIVSAGRLGVPSNFEVTAAPYDETQDWRSVPDQPLEYTNPQTAAFCSLLGVDNLWDATEEERLARRAAGPPPVSEFRSHRGGRGRGDGRGWGGRGTRGGGRGRGRGRFHRGF